MEDKMTKALNNLAIAVLAIGCAYQAKALVVNVQNTLAEKRIEKALMRTWGSFDSIQDLESTIVQ
jgi:hypothetical protein